MPEIKSTPCIPLGHPVEYSEIDWLPRLNIRQDYGSESETRATRDVMTNPSGWLPQFPCTAEEALPNEIDEILERRRANHDRFKALLNEKEIPSVQVPFDGRNVSVNGREFTMAKLAIIEWLYLDGKGRFKRPRYIGTDCNRRGGVLVDALTCRLLQLRSELKNEKLQPKEVEDRLPIRIPIVNLPDYVVEANVGTEDKPKLAKLHRFPSLDARMAAQIEENELKKAGSKDMTDTERLSVAHKLVTTHGWGQNDVRNRYKNVLGLRLYFASAIENYIQSEALNMDRSEEERAAFDNIKFMERLQLPKWMDDKKESINPRWLDFSKFQQKSFQGDGKPEFPAMGPMCYPEADFAKYNRGQVAKGKPAVSRPSAEEILNWIDAQLGGKSKAPNQLPRDKIEEFTTSAPNPFVKDAMKAVNANKVEHLDRANAKASVSKYVYQTGDEEYGELDAALLGLKTLSVPTRLVLLREFRSKIDEALQVAATATPVVEEVVPESENEESEAVQA